MCGIVGILNLANDEPVAERHLRQMLALIRHRGPDQFGIFLNHGVGLGSARLSILDVGHGQQPISNEDGSLWIVFNGEIFNYLELRVGLEKRGHQFKTNTDTEVLLHLFEDYGADCLQRLNGQFAFAIWNSNDRSAFLARDRFGIRPLFYTQGNGSFIFGSEIKSIFGSGRVRPVFDPVGIDQVFRFWSTVSPRTVFKNIVELPPAHWLRVSAEGIQIRRYWQLQFAEHDPGNTNPGEQLIQERAEELRALLTNATKIRLRADVPVGAYLSGGLDSSVIAALARVAVPQQLNTFSISFSGPEFDESEFQQRMARHLDTKHEVLHADHKDIGRVFPEVVWHCETPLLRTAPAPMFLLSSLVQRHGLKVVLTGEGADEILGGYDIFKEDKIRRFWATQSKSHFRSRLLERLYPEIAGFKSIGPGFLAAFFGEGLENGESSFYSHLIRWRNGLRLRRFYCDELLALANQNIAIAPPIELPSEFSQWGSLDRAQHLEISVFLANYLLSSQGDRMAMAHSVEGRFPFLDFRVAEFCAKLPPRLKLRVLKEKYLLRRIAEPLLPAEILHRRKRPYRAPIHGAFFDSHPEAYVEELLSPAALRESGLFKPAAVSQLVSKLRAGVRIGEMDDMALAGILSTQLLHHQFITDFRAPAPLGSGDNIKICFGNDFVSAPSYAF
jgi:asparagine synthase (glutamine-hydrolysing)